MVSIVRAYYTWVVDNGTDKSYGLGIENICAAAELAIGIIVGCLPIMPKFLQHASVKLSKAFSFASRSTIKARQGIDHESNGQSDTPKAKTLTSLRRSFAKYKAGADVTESWNGHYHSRPENYGDHITLTEFDALSLQAIESVKPCSRGGGIATRREDLEHGPLTS